MRNLEVARALEEVADLMDIKGVGFKPRAYRRAAQAVESLPEDVEDFYQRGELTEIRGVGDSIAKDITQFLETGRMDVLDDLRREIPEGVVDMTEVEGIGPKTASKLYNELGLESLEELEEAAREGRIRRLKGMGEKTERRILEGIEFAKKKGERQPLGYVLPMARQVVDELRELPEVEEVRLVGSIRRRRETIGDLDILVVSEEPDEVVEFFVSMDEVEGVVVKGAKKTTVRLEGGLEADLRPFSREEFGAALVYFTGSKAHNVQLRNVALEKGLTLNEYRLAEKDSLDPVASETEEEIYGELGLSWIPPELREASGEVEAAAEGELPDLVEYDALRGDLQVHTEWSDGKATVSEMAQAAEEMGYEYLAITDHSQSLGIASGLDPEDYRRQREEVEEVDEEVELELLHGAEVNIDKDGEPDLPDEALAEFDVVLGSIHYGMKGEEEAMTRRLVRAMENEHVDIIAHPTGRMINERPAYPLDLERVFSTAVETETLLEINGFPSRMDLSSRNARMAKEAGTRFVVSTDSHNTDHLRYAELGLGIARRAWLTADHVLNTRTLASLLKSLK